MVIGTPQQFLDPSLVVSHFLLRSGDTVADFGAGTGHFMKPLADAVAPNGRVYMCDIQKSMVDALGNRARELRLSSVYPLWCDLEASGGTTLADNLLDAGILVNTLFQIENKDSALAEMSRVVRTGGKFFIVDWSESFGGLGPQPAHICTESSAREYALRAGFVFERVFPAGEHHYGIAFRKS